MSDNPSDVEVLVEAKKAKLKEAMEDTRVSELEMFEPEDLKFAISLYDRFTAGEIRNLDRNRVRWIPPGAMWRGPDLFEFIPKRERPFEFAPARGNSIIPRNMFTDVGTIPRLAGVFFRGLSPWGYAPAYIVHDWEFELHHCQRTRKTFEQVRDTMMECVKTLMETRLTPKSTFQFWLLYQAIDSRVARDYWNRHPPMCTLPPDAPE